jgi:hypothetical protein
MWTVEEDSVHLRKCLEIVGELKEKHKVERQMRCSIV